MGIRPSAETNSGDGNQLAVDQIGEVYANVKTVADNIADVSQVAENLDQLEELGDVAEQTLTNATAAANSAAAADASADAAQASQIAAAASATTASADAATATAAVAEIDADRVAAEAAAVSALASKNAAETANTNAQTAKTGAETAQTGAAASAATATTKAADATTQAGIATTKAAEALGSANAAATQAANALASANLADADRIAAEAAKTLSETAKTLAETALAAALAAQAAAEAARDEAEDIAGGDLVTGSELTTALATKLSFTDGGGPHTWPTGTARIAYGGFAVENPDGSVFEFFADDTAGQQMWGISDPSWTHYWGIGQVSGTRVLIDGDRAFEFSQTPYAGANILLTAATGAKLAGGNTFTGTQNFAGIIATDLTSKSTTLGNIGSLNLSNSDGSKWVSLWNSGDNLIWDSWAPQAFTVNGTTKWTVGAAALAAAVPITVPASAYGAGWNGSLEVATKDAIYDEIEALKGLVVGAMVYKGTWNATTNSPAIPAASAANKGWFYKVATAGSTSVSGITDWQIGDWIVSNGTSWDKIDNTETVSSVNGQTGAVSLTASSFTLTGFSSASGGSIVAADTVLAAFGKAQNSIDVLAAAIADVQNGYAFTGPISTDGDVTTTGVNAGVQLGDRDLTGNITLYNNGNFFRVYINSGDRFTVDGSGNIVAGGNITATNGGLTLTRTGSNAVINLLKTGGNTCTIQTDGGNLILTGPVLRNRAAGHYWETEDGVTLMGQLGLDSGVPKLQAYGSIYAQRPSSPGHVGFRLYNGGGTVEWEMHHPAAGDSNDFRIATVVAGTYTNRFWITPSGATTINAALTVNGDITATSDRNLKKHIAYKVGFGLDEVCQLRPATYRWKGENKAEKEIGLIAQDVEEIFPELVRTDEDGKKSVNYQKLSVVLLQAVKELTARVEALEA